MIVVLFVLQLVSFYFIIILNTKIARFNNLEKKQERLMSEMDDTVAAYLSEIKDENNRLISELGNVKVQQSDKISTQSVQPDVKKPISPVVDVELEQRLLTPKNLVANAYSKQMVSQQMSTQAKKEDLHANEPVLPVTERPKILTIEEQVIELAKKGESAETIARKLQKGKTEIELLLKFHS